MKQRYKLLAICLTAYCTISFAQKVGNWFVTSSLQEKKDALAGIQLNDGNILVTGGNTPSQYLPSNETEIYDVKSQMWKVAVPMNKGRAYHSLIKLKDGSIMAIGGYSEKTCEILSNDYTKWTFTDTINTRKYWGQNVVLMQDGNVLSIGGYINTSNDTTGALRECEIYSYLERNWELTSKLNIGRFEHTATVLKDGRVLVTGGWTEYHGRILLNSCEIFDPTTKKWTYVQPMHYPRARHSATLLSNGKVLIVGGLQNYSELYNPLTNNWEVVGSVNLASGNNRAVMLKNEEYLLLVHDVYGARCGWELYSLKNFKSIYYEEFKRIISDPEVIKIDDNKVIVAGGFETILSGGVPVFISSNFCQIYDINYTSVSVKEIVNQNHLQTDFSLSCYPNPSNNSTNIIANLNSSGWIIMKVYNILGSEISTIYNGELAAGRHEFRYDMERFPSGIYFVRISSQNKTQLLKIIHQK